MAEISLDGLDEAIRAMEQADIYDDETTQEILFAGADDLKGRIGENIARSRFRLGGYVASIKPGKVKVDEVGVPYVTVSSSSKNARGVSRGAVLFVLNYGRPKKYGKIEGGYFWTRARVEAQKKFPEIVEKIAAEKLKERGLI